MDANEARQHTENAKKTFAEMDTQPEQLQALIDARCTEQRIKIDSEIEKAAFMGKQSANYSYSERISMSRTSATEVREIKLFADTVTASLVDTLKQDGFTAWSKTPVLVRDIRDTVGSPPEYYDTLIAVSW